MTKKTPAPLEEQETAVSQFVDYGDDYDQGTDTEASEQSLPMLKILQSQSKEIHPVDTLNGGRAGLILNTGSLELMDSVRFVPAIRQHKFVAWRDRKAGGGIVAVHDPNDPVVLNAQAASTSFGKYFDEDGNKLAETYYLFGIVCDDDGSPEGMAVIAFASTQIKKWKKGIKRRMDAVMVPAPGGRKRRPPIYAHQLIFSIQPEEGNDQHWFGWVPQFAVDNNVKASLMTPDNPAFQAAKELRTRVEEGSATADVSAQETTASSDEKDDIPF